MLITLKPHTFNRVRGVRAVLSTLSPVTVGRGANLLTVAGGGLVLEGLSFGDVLLDGEEDLEAVVGGSVVAPVRDVGVGALSDRVGYLSEGVLHVELGDIEILKDVLGLLGSGGVFERGGGNEVVAFYFVAVLWGWFIWGFWFCLCFFLWFFGLILIATGLTSYIG